MAKAKMGDTVVLHYQGYLEDKTVFDSSLDRQPIQVLLGEESILDGVEQAIVGMEAGDTKTIILPPEKAYGEYTEGKGLTVRRDQISEDCNPEPGMVLELTSADEGTIAAPILEVTPETVVIDSNHPLAGKTLTYEVSLIKILSTSQNGSD
jgi:peptidylprolyl isomerase